MEQQHSDVYRDKVLESHVETLFLFREMALGILHNLVNNLHGVDSALLMIQTLSEAETSESEVHNLARDARRHLNDSLTLMSRLMHQGRSFRPTPVECRLTDDVVRPALKRYMYQKADVALHHSFTETDYVVAVDPEYMMEAITTLLSNAIRAIRERRGRERVVTVIVRPVDDATVCIQVDDSGIGIQPENVHRLFQPFFTTRRDGTGLGLYSARRIVEQFGGSLRLKRSLPGKGATFVIVLPYVKRVARPKH